jgi:phage gpG-like protein
MAAKFNNLTWMWNQRQNGRTVAEILAENERTIFAEGQGIWQGLTPKYAAWKAKRGYDPRILVKTGRMMTAATVPGSQDNISFGDARNYYYGVNAENFRDFGGWSYPEIHQIHGQGGKRRRFVHLLASTRQELNFFFGNAVQDEMQAQANRSRLRSFRARMKRRYRFGVQQLSDS